MHENIQKSDKRYAVDSSLIMRPSSLGGGRIMRRTLSVCLSVCLSVRPVIVAIGRVFSAPLASRMYFSARTEGRISYGHLGRTDSCLIIINQNQIILVIVYFFANHIYLVII